MCYHTSIPDRKVIIEEFDYALLDAEWENNLNHLSGFAYAKTPVITAENPDKVQLFNWGLIPKWVKNEEDAAKYRQWCLNATCENVFDKPSFKTSIGKKRCLVIVDGFYEWREYKSKKYPYFINVKNRKAFGLAGLYDSWVNKETGEILNTYSIITCAANPLMEKIHNVKKRMPVILPKEKERVWLNENLSKEEIQNLM